MSPRCIPAHLDDLVWKLRASKYFTKLDLKSSFHQLLFINLATFATLIYLFRFKRVCFELISAPAAFQRIMSKIIHGFDGVVCCLDDILVFGPSLEEHDQRVRNVLTRVRESGLTLNDKCIFRETSIDFLGFHVDGEGIKPAGHWQNSGPPGCFPIEDILGNV